MYYREHPTRKNGVKFDRQWIIRQTLGGVQRVSVVGWMSEGHLIGDAMNKAAEYKSNHKWNQQNPDKPRRPICRQDEDDAAALLAAQIERQRKQEAFENVTFADFFNDSYLPIQHSNKKKSIGREQVLFKYHLEPVIGNLTFKQIQSLHIERIKKNMVNKGQSPRHIQYALAVARQIWTTAVKARVTNLQNPIKEVKSPKVNNKKDRFFTYEEEALYLDELAKRSPITHDMAVMSLDTGARWSELAKLQWQHVNLTAETVRLIDTKAGDDRTLHLATNRVRAMLQLRYDERQSDFVFPATDGGQQEQVNRVSYRVIKELGFNTGKDRKHWLSFHSCRHTCASRLAMAGVPLYTIKDVLGHHTIKTTERYAHLLPSASREALELLERTTGDNTIPLHRQIEKTSS
ncbi:tyrosine-type recombinase/integrase [Geoalkalibacter subterraneus]|uniref:tyrosine-type recombinase/integrase n=1 Tax=Geoalkalibacter subterraneus TaxID=483547 RepID=UPI00130E06AB|nr:site-specific integrase [Geoalkalibacter subterraneus]